VSDFEFGIWLKPSRHLLHGVELLNARVNLYAERREQMSQQYGLAAFLRRDASETRA